MQTGVSKGVPRIVDVRRQVENDDLRWWGMFLTLIGFTLIIGLIAYSSAPEPLSIALLVLIVSCVAAFLRPVVGVYLIVFLTLIGDLVTSPWWPFTKNMSSRESILFVHDSLILNPLELLAGMTLAAWLLQRLADPTWRFNRGRLFWPLTVFTGFVVIGVLRGRASGGDTRAAIFEFRPLLYLLVVYLLVTNLLTTRRQYRRLFLLAMLGISIQSIFSLTYYRGLPLAERELLESLSEHSATIHMNALIVFTLAVWLFKCRRWLCWTMVGLCVPVVWAYMLSQRRAAMISLFVGGFVLLVVLYFRRRRAFWFCAPASVIVAIGFVVATWNAQGALGLPAQAVKTVLFSDQLTDVDRSSDFYRQIEAFDLWVSIRASPLTGLGFGQKFLRPIALPDISFFEFWEYLPHNSVLWVWIKTGFFGFAAMLFMFARAVQLGARSALKVRTAEQAAVVVAGLSYAVMFLVFAYVDIAWGARSTVFLALAFAICGDLLDADDETERLTEGVHTRQLESVVR